jgi:hypothetical protein
MQCATPVKLLSSLMNVPHAERSSRTFCALKGMPIQVINLGSCLVSSENPFPFLHDIKVLQIDQYTCHICNEHITGHDEVQDHLGTHLLKLFKKKVLAHPSTSDLAPDMPSDEFSRRSSSHTGIKRRVVGARGVNRSQGSSWAKEHEDPDQRVHHLEEKMDILFMKVWTGEHQSVNLKRALWWFWEVWSCECI